MPAAKLLTTSLPWPNVLHKVIWPILVVDCVPIQCVGLFMVPGPPALIPLHLPPFILGFVEVAGMYLEESIRKAAAPIVGVIFIWEWSSH